MQVQNTILIVDASKEDRAVYRQYLEGNFSYAYNIVEIEACNRDETKLKEMIHNFITITSHEFRTPLTTILGSAELLGYYGKDWDEERIIFHINRIQSSVQHMVRMLDNLLFL